MLQAISRWLRGEESGISVPPMDGVLKPNNKLESAERLLVLPAVDNLATDGTSAYCSSGKVLYRLKREGDLFGAEPAGEFEGPVTCIATGPGRIAVGVQGKGILVFDGRDGWRQHDLPSPLSSCATAADFCPDGKLIVCVGSQRNAASDWKRDLLENGHTGSILSIDESGRIETLRGALAFPYGIIAHGVDDFVYSESWRYRLTESRGSGVVLADLPAYPARLARAADGGLWLSLFAPRRQLFEMVLREHDYRREMMSTIPPSDWIGPELNSEGGPDQPLQAGSVRQMGIIKPWAPSRSYGLVVKCNPSGHPVASWHSRADGTMHGITSVLEFGDDVLVTAKGANTLLRLPREAEA